MSTRKVWTVSLPFNHDARVDTQASLTLNIDGKCHFIQGDVMPRHRHDPPARRTARETDAQRKTRVEGVLAAGHQLGEPDLRWAQEQFGLDTIPTQAELTAILEQRRQQG